MTKTLVVWKTSLPPGRSSLAASGTQRAGSHHKLAPRSEMARPKLRLELGRSHIHPGSAGRRVGPTMRRSAPSAAELDDI